LTHVSSNIGEAAVDRNAQPLWGMTPLRKRRLMIAILVCAALLRIYGLGERSTLWEDELSVWEYALTGESLGVPNEAPLYSWLQFLWMWWIHAPTANTMQLLSISLGVLDVAVAFYLGRMIAGSAAGLLAAALMAVVPLALVLSHEVRPYTLFMVASGWLMAAYVVAWERDTIGTWLAYGAALAAAALSHLLVLQVCVALGTTSLAALWIERDRGAPLARFSRFAAASAVFGLLGVSWLLDRPDQSRTLAGPHTDGVFDFMQNLVMSLGGATRASMLPGLAVATLAILGLWQLARTSATKAILLGSVIAISAYLTWANLALMSGSSWHGWQRYLAHLLIPYLVLVAIGTQWIAGRVVDLVKPRRGSSLAWALLLLPLLLVAPGTARWLEQPIRHRMVKNLDVYATFACQQQSRVLGHLLVEVVRKSEPWLSQGPIRRRNAYELARHDTLDLYGASRFGVYELEGLPGRAEIADVLRRVPLASPPRDGAYIVFPPSFGCDALVRAPIRGVSTSRTVMEERWGLICDVDFE
jgi:hypothetical protein